MSELNEKLNPAVACKERCRGRDKSVNLGTFQSGANIFTEGANCPTSSPTDSERCTFS